MVLARDERAWPHAVEALGARLGLLVVVLGVEQPSDLELALGHALHTDRARPDLALAPRAPLLSGDRRATWQGQPNWSEIFTRRASAAWGSP